MKTIEELNKDISVYSERTTADCEEVPVLPYSEQPASWWGKEDEDVEVQPDVANK